MTSYEIINTAFGLLGEKFDDYPDKTLPVIWLNITAAESLDAENRLRKKSGLTQIEICPAVKELYDDVDLQLPLCSICLPYGVAAYLASDRENGYMAAVMRNRFISSLQEAAKAEENGIADCYGGGAV